MLLTTEEQALGQGNQHQVQTGLSALLPTCIKPAFRVLLIMSLTQHVSWTKRSVPILSAQRVGTEDEFFKLFAVQKKKRKGLHKRARSLYTHRTIATSAKRPRRSRTNIDGGITAKADLATFHSVLYTSPSTFPRKWLFSVVLFFWVDLEERSCV